MSQANRTNGNASLLLTVFLGLAAVVGMSRWLDSRRPAVDASIEEETLYLNATTVKRLSLGFNGLAADLYWMRTLQYVGNKILDLPPGVRVDNLGQLDLKLLVPLLDSATTLDPQFMAPYQYAAAVLPEIDVREAIRIINKGINANPSSWRLYHNLGYIYWQQEDFTAAREAYGQGAALPGAPAWMTAMKARMLNEGGSRNTAREIFARMHEEAADDLVKNMARARLLQLDYFDQRDALRRLLAGYQSKIGRCPESWREVGGVLQAAKVRIDSSAAPLDPTGKPYVLLKGKCDIELDPKSGVPAK